MVYYRIVREGKRGLLDEKTEEGFLRLSFDEIEVARHLFGPREENIKYLKKYFNIKASIRGTNLTLIGGKKDIEDAGKVISELQNIVKKGFTIHHTDIDHAVHFISHPQHQSEETQKDGIYIAASKKIITSRTRNQKLYIDAIRKHDMVISIGPAGTGKTYLAMAMALSAYYRKEVSRIVLTRPAIEAGEKLGYLPGTMYEKVNPYLRPLYDALYDMVDMDRAARLLERGVIEIAPLAFMRGRTLNDAFIILDEAQNTASEQMKMFLTRLGFSSKTVITGDVTQIDLAGQKDKRPRRGPEYPQGHKGHKVCLFHRERCCPAPACSENYKSLRRTKLGSGGEEKCQPVKTNLHRISIIGS